MNYVLTLDALADLAEIGTFLAEQKSTQRLHRQWKWSSAGYLRWLLSSQSWEDQHHGKVFAKLLSVDIHTE